MATLNDPEVQKLLGDPNYAVVSTLRADGSIHDTIVWISAENGEVAVNSAVGRRWPANLERDPRITVLVPESGNPYNFVEIRGTVTSTRGPEADEHINRLSKKYTGQDEFPGRRPNDQRVKFVIEPDHIRHVRQR